MVLVTRPVRAGRAREFEAWLEQIRSLAARHGSQGMAVIPPLPGSTEYAIIYRFADAEAQRAWRSAPGRATLLAASADLAEAAPAERELTGLEGWFAPGDGALVRPPARWKSWLVTLIALYVLLVTITALAEPLLAPLSIPVRFAVLLPVLTALMTWSVMPRLSRLLARWLYS
ncbi:antibiotic biosynthesis monooxygenase [Nonomuraea sp. NPDC049400]|uniref:antibiotic biosynthesis monooxygenase n=1 Tax=Nonomuraea sp. NPDC049400 TaxID=3364352 RepID=UPI0037A2A7F2